MENKLISMTDFVLYQWNFAGISDSKKIRNCAAYAQFLKQPLTLGMFVPVDEAGNVLEEPQSYEWYIDDNEQYFNGDPDECIAYQKAQEKVLFKGFEMETTENNKFQYLWLDKKFICSFPLNNADRIRNVDDLIPYEIELTPCALKQIGLKTD